MASQRPFGRGAGCPRRLKWDSRCRRCGPRRRRASPRKASGTLLRSPPRGPPPPAGYILTDQQDRQSELRRKTWRQSFMLDSILIHSKHEIHEQVNAYCWANISKTATRVLFGSCWVFKLACIPTVLRASCCAVAAFIQMTDFYCPFPSKNYSCTTRPLQLPSTISSPSAELCWSRAFPHAVSSCNVANRGLSTGHSRCRWLPSGLSGSLFSTT